MLIGLMRDNTLKKTFTLPQLTEAFKRKYHDYRIIIEPKMHCGEQTQPDIDNRLSHAVMVTGNKIEPGTALFISGGLGDILQLRFALNAYLRCKISVELKKSSPSTTDFCIFTSENGAYLLSDLPIIVKPLSIFKSGFQRIINLNSLILSKINDPRIAFFTTILNELVEKPKKINISSADINLNLIKKHRKCNLIAVQLEASSKYRTFPLEKWQRIFHACKDKKFFVYSKREHIELPANCLNFTGGKLPLPELLTEISGCKCFITTDSFSVHIAAAFKRPCIILSGPTTPDISCYRNRNYIVESTGDCKNCYDKILVQKDCPDISCLAGIEEKKVIELLENI